MRLLETNILPVQQACQKQGDGYGCTCHICNVAIKHSLHYTDGDKHVLINSILAIALNMNELGCNLQKLAKGTQLENRSKKFDKCNGHL